MYCPGVTVLGLLYRDYNVYVTYDKARNKVDASRRDWRYLREIAALRTKTEVEELGRWRGQGDELLWLAVVGQVCNRGGISWFERLKQQSALDAFYRAVSLSELRKMAARGSSALQHYVRRQMEDFHVGRFREDNTLAIVANFEKLFRLSEGVSEIRKELDKLDCTRLPLGPRVQDCERQARVFLMQNLVFYQNRVERQVKRKPASDLLIYVGFARTLMAFDTRLKQVFRELFGLRIDESNYEAVEDWFLAEAEPAFHLTPSEFDRIIFQHKERILQLAQAAG